MRTRGGALLSAFLLKPVMFLLDIMGMPQHSCGGRMASMPFFFRILTTALASSGW